MCRRGFRQAAQTLQSWPSTQSHHRHPQEEKRRRGEARACASTPAVQSQEHAELGVPQALVAPAARPVREELGANLGIRERVVL